MKVDDLSKEFGILTAQFEAATLEEVAAACKETGDQVRSQLRTTSPKRTGKYSRGWKVTVTKGRFKATADVHNTEYRLVHLLEFGHAKVNGGRTKAIPHVEPAQDMADNLFLENLRRKIEADK